MEKEYSLIVAAMQVEFDALKNILKEYKVINVCDEELIEFTLNNENYLLGLGKIGKVNTAYFLGKLFSHLKIKRLFNIGTSGGVNPSLNISDIIIADKVAYYDVDACDFGYQIGQVPGMPAYYTPDMEYINSKKIEGNFEVKIGTILSGDSFVSRRVFNSSPLKNQLDIMAVEMESGAVAQCCYLANIPFVIVRSISDIVTHDNNYNEIDNNECHVSTNSALALLELIK